MSFFDILGGAASFIPGVGPLVGAGIGAIGAAVSGGEESSQGLDEASQRYVELQRQYGTEAANQITGFDPATGQFGQPAIGPITEQFDMESINRFLSPFLAEQEARIGEEFDFSEARDVRGARQEATLAGTGRGSRGAVLEALTREGSQRNRARALTDVRVGGFGQAGQLALGAQPFRNLFAREPLDRLQAGQNFLSGGFGQGGQVARGPDPSILSGALAGATVGAGFDGDAGTIPAAPPPVTGVQPPSGIIPPPNFNDFRLQPPQFGSGSGGLLV